MDDQHSNPASAMLRRKLFEGLGRAERAGPEGTSDEGRMRDIMTAVSPAHADLIPHRNDRRP
ncbi:hypothetical protein F7R91_41695 [Streptomyces luteolifulvus]|uniref:Uncharacterized protein n=1 Tax=Streptomyces luteolifulvus TaxID=2615112 RepID=A0A643JPK0_9ACTN|nr:hypothetical protein [Streptomyces luteolifulvus]KAB1138831.1 hypothetical protein F7R91_41695 [Streptomyces luteolifulvus]